MSDYFGKLVRFKSFNCPYCKALLPVEVHYENKGQLRVFCTRCKKCVYLYKQQVVK